MANMANIAKESRDEYFAALADVKKRLPSHGVTSLVAKRFPEYDDKVGRARISNVLHFRTRDEKLLSYLIEIADGLTSFSVIRDMAARTPRDETFGAAVRLYLQKL